MDLFWGRWSEAKIVFRNRRGKDEEKQGRVIKAASRKHLQGMKLLPKSPLDSNLLRREREEGSVILRKSEGRDVLSGKSGEEEEWEWEREPNASAYKKKRRSQPLQSLP